MNKCLEKCIAQNMPIIFDYDGVLFEARWYEDRINMRDETEEKLVAAHKKGKNLYTAPIPMMQKWVASLNNELFVLSHIHDQIEYDYKCEQIEKFYPVIPRRRIMWAKSQDDKIPFLNDIRRLGGSFIYIDDSHSALIKFENYFDEYSDECKFFHVSSLFV